MKLKQFDDCIECHKQAAECLQDAQKLTNNPHSLESLKLQQVYHQKQIDVVRMKKKMDHETQIRKLILGQINLSLLNANMDGNHDDLENKIYMTIEKHDSLIDCLGR